MIISICASTCIFLGALCIIWWNTRKVITQIKQSQSAIQSLNEYYIGCTQFYIDCHQYSLLALRLYTIGVMKSATDHENYELANSCKEMVAEMEKLIIASQNRNQNKK